MRKLFFVALLLAAPPFVTSVARAQISDPDRAAARDLFFEGVKLQNEGKFPEALDRFSRAQRIFSAPTHLLHVAECQVATGLLVEGAETYRTLVRTPLPPNSPPAFTQARDQGGAELAQVEPRIPTVKIDVTPQNVANLQVQIDGAPMNNALVGVARPIDPGSHKITVFAPGYAKQDVPLAIKERETKSIPVTLVAQGGVVYSPTPVPTQGPTSTEPPPAYNTQPPPPTPPADQQTWSPESRQSNMSLLGGLRVGVMFPTGTLLKANTTTTTTTGTTDLAMSDYATTGGAVAIEGGVRFARRFYVGIGLEHGFYGKGDKLGTPNGTGTTSTSTSTTVSSNLIDLRAAFISNPDGIGFYGELGVGYRWLMATQDVSTDTFNTSTTSDTARGLELEAGAGVFIKAGKYVRFIPKVSFGLGAFTKLDHSDATSTTSDDIENTGLHTFVFLGLGGYYNYDLDKR
jgi:hypothetical protein